MWSNNARIEESQKEFLKQPQVLEKLKEVILSKGDNPEEVITLETSSEGNVRKSYQTITAPRWAFAAADLRYNNRCNFGYSVFNAELIKMVELYIS